MIDPQVTKITLRMFALLLLWAGIILVFPIERGYAGLHAALLSEEQGDYKEASLLYQRAGRYLFWRRVELLETAGDRALRAGDAQLAMTILFPLNQKNLLTPQGKYLLAQAYLQGGIKNSAVILLEELARQEYRPLDIFPELLPIYLSRRAYPQAESALQNLIALAPDNAVWQYQLGLVRLALQPEKALPHLRRAAQLQKTYAGNVAMLEEQLILGQKENIPAVMYLFAGRGLASIEEWELAEEAFRRAVALRPDYAEAWAYLGLAKGQIVRRLLTSTGLEQFSSQTPVDKELHSYLIEHSGLSEIQHALRLDPSSQAGLAFLTLYWQQRGYPELALVSARQSAVLYPNDLNVQIQYAHALVLTGDLNTAWEVIVDTGKRTADKVSARKALVSFCVQNDFRLAETALPEARLLVYQQPADVESMDLLAQVLFGLGYSQRARQWLLRAVKLDPGFAPAYLHLGMISISEGYISQALEELKQAVEYGGGTPVAGQAIRLIKMYSP